MLLIKQNQNLKQDRNNFMDQDSHKSTWNNFTKFVLWGNCCGYISFSINGDILIVNFLYENSFSFRKSQY